MWTPLPPPTPPSAARTNVAPTSGGDGEDLGLLGLIQQSLKNAQAIKQGGPQGKQAAAAAAGQISAASSQALISII
ncbi:hypothetical protein OSTOST_20109 [Ostertagia ostertagi]